MPKVVNRLSGKLVCKMGMGPRTNLYNIGGDPLTQLNLYAIKRTFQPKHSTNGMFPVGDTDSI